MPADLISRAVPAVRPLLALLLVTVAAFVAGCGGEDVQTTSSSLEKPALTVPEGSVESKSSTRGSTSATGSTGDTADDTTDSGSDTGTDTDTGGAGTGTDTGTDTGGNTGGDENTGGAGLGN